MNIRELQARTDTALRALCTEYPWAAPHGCGQDVTEDGEPYVFGVIQMPHLLRWLYKLKILRLPPLPERLDDVIVRVFLRPIAYAGRPPSWWVRWVKRR